jgi:hypothetical protein
VIRLTEGNPAKDESREFAAKLLRKAQGLGIWVNKNLLIINSMTRPASFAPEPL